MNKVNLKLLPNLLPYSVRWEDFFNNTNPVDLEIGCGRTHFFFDRVFNFPERNIVGIEWKYEFIEQGQRRIMREEISNAALFHGNAWSLVPLLFQPQSINQVFVNFPDPWWKERHKKRLVLNEVFLDSLKQRMQPDGLIIVQTDVQDLFEFYKKLITNHGFNYLDYPEHAIKKLTQAQTHREKKCLEHGQTIFRGGFGFN